LKEKTTASSSSRSHHRARRRRIAVVEPTWTLWCRFASNWRKPTSTCFGRCSAWRITSPCGQPSGRPGGPARVGHREPGGIRLRQDGGRHLGLHRRVLLGQPVPGDPQGHRPEGLPGRVAHNRPHRVPQRAPGGAWPEGGGHPGARRAGSHGGLGVRSYATGSWTLARLTEAWRRGNCATVGAARLRLPR
jgi:hypothetical protein